MKKVVEVNIGRINFTIEDDAYINLKSYLNRFESSITEKNDAEEIMEDIEIRVAEIFQKEMKYPNQVINQKMVDKVIDCLGEVDTNAETNNTKEKMNTTKKLYRDIDDKKIAGVCSGLAAYFGIDVTLIRIIFLVALIGYGSTLVIYIILWIVMPEALTRVQKLEMRGEPITTENLKK
jgi:phage shock protein PspC (stress-responsive transcriptional regulator)